MNGNPRQNPAYRLTPPHFVFPAERSRFRRRTRPIETLPTRRTSFDSTSRHPHPISSHFPPPALRCARMRLLVSSCALLSIRGNPLFLSGNSASISLYLLANSLWPKEKCRHLLDSPVGWGYSARRCRKV